MKATRHGGDLFTLAQAVQCKPEDILDFSVNLRPEGAPPFLRRALLRAMDYLHVYPSPHAEEACLAAANRYAHAAQCFVFGNGSNELIHAVARFFALQGKKHAFIMEPAFSEYALACNNAGLKVHALWGGVQALHMDECKLLLEKVPAGAVVFMANPANPSGIFYSRQDMLTLITQRPELTFIVDEAFIEYAGAEENVSLVMLLADHFPQNLLILRSLTKFHAIAGVRLGFLLATEELAQGIKHILPAWTVNCFAIQAAIAVLSDTSDFAEQTRKTNASRREHLMTQLQTVDGIEIFPSVANYILFRLNKALPNLPKLLLQNHRIAIRDCSNYYGLEDNTWYRAAVRFACEHRRLSEALTRIFHECI